MEFASLEPLAGGWSGETFVARVGVGADAERAVVRICARDPGRAEVDAALLRLVRGLVPVAEVLEVRPPSRELPALLVTSFLPGTRGDLLLPDLDAAGLALVGNHVGAILATLGGMPMLRSGDLVGPDLRVEPWGPADGLADGLPGWVDSHRDAFVHWTGEERAGLDEVADRAQGLLDTVERHCLVHSDLNPKNLLIDPDSLAVTGLLDWEYAHAGHPFTDLGNVLRFERHSAWVEAVLATYAERRGTLPTEALELARAADLWALIDLAARRGANPVADRAHDQLLEVARARDVHAAASWTDPRGRA